MSNYKPLYSKIWSDDDFGEYFPEEKLLYIYLLTNSHVEKSGIYKINIRQMAFETGIASTDIKTFLLSFVKQNKIKYDFENKIIFIPNLFKFNKGTVKNPNVLVKTMRTNYNFTKCSFWKDFFKIYQDDDVVKYLLESINKKIDDKNINFKNFIDGSLMNHQTSNSNSNSNSKNNIEEDIKDIIPTKGIKKFKKPSLEEVKEYCKELRSIVNPNSFVDFYESKGWKVGKNPMKDWRAALRNWNNRERDNLPPSEKECEKEIEKRKRRKEFEDRILKIDEKSANFNRIMSKLSFLGRFRSRLKFSFYESKKAYFVAKDKQARDWIVREYGSGIRDLISKEFKNGAISFICSADNPSRLIKL
jgi:hypothetical protein